MRWMAVKHGGKCRSCHKEIKPGERAAVGDGVGFTCSICSGRKPKSTLATKRAAFKMQSPL